MTDAAFWDAHAEGYARRKIGNQTAYEEGLDRTRKHLTANDVVLELGCGTGTTALLLAPSVARYTGTDVSPAMIDIANRKRQAGDAGSVDFQVAGADELPDFPYDAILAFNLLHLVADPARTIAAIFETLPRGGRFISKTPCISGKPWLRIAIAAMRVFGKAPHVVFFDAATYEDMIRAAGFRILESDTLPAPSRYVVAVKP